MRIKHWLSLDIGPDEDVILEKLTGGTLFQFKSKTLWLRSELTSLNPCRMKKDTIIHHKKAETANPRRKQTLEYAPRTDSVRKIYWSGASFAKKTLDKPWIRSRTAPRQTEDVILEKLNGGTIFRKTWPEERYYGSSPKHCAFGQKPHRSNIKNRRGETCVGAGTYASPPPPYPPLL